MGIIRTLLAIAVVIGHAPGWGAKDQFGYLRFVSPYYSVQAFFVISGFYMALVRENYFKSTWIFYTNRYSRLIVSYAIILSATIIAAIVFPVNGYTFASYVPQTSSETVLLCVTNITIFGLDLIAILSPTSMAGMILPQAWSISTELWFYALVPIFWRLKTKWLVAVLVASVCCRLAIVASTLPFFPWQQRLFPAELMFFLLGILSHRFKRQLTASRGTSLVLFIFTIAAIGLLGHLADQKWHVSIEITLALALVLPSVFELSRNFRLDRLIGEYSYPIYLWHIGIGFFLLTQLPETEISHHGAVLLAIGSIIASIPLVRFVEIPMENWRRRRLSQARTRSIESSIP